MTGTEAKQFATFRIDSLYFGIPVHEVQEIIRAQQLTKVPLAPRVVRGLINLRGQIVTAIDLRRRLAMQNIADESEMMNIVVQREDEVVSLLVDGVGDVIEVDTEHFEATPPTLNAKLRDLVTGVYKLSDRVMLVLDVAAAVTTTPDGGRDESARCR